MNKITVIAIAAASFFAGLCLGQLMGNSGNPAVTATVYKESMILKMITYSEQK